MEIFAKSVRMWQLSEKNSLHLNIVTLKYIKLEFVIQIALNNWLSGWKILYGSVRECPIMQIINKVQK